MQYTLLTLLFPYRIISLYQIAGIQLAVNGVTSTYANNSIVTRTDIGTGDAALLCTTTYSPCCSSGNPDTQWYFPNGSLIVNSFDLPYYRTRNNPDFGGRTVPRSVLLHRNPQGTTTGIFRCDIFDDSGVLQSIYVGIYDNNTGECRRWCMHILYSRNQCLLIAIATCLESTLSHAPDIS